MGKYFFKEKVVYIFGGSSGIGLESAKLLAAEGARIVIFARNKSKLDSAVKYIKENSLTASQEITSVSADVTDYKKLEKILNETVENMGIPDIVINSAGMASPKYFTDIEYNDFDKIVKLNLYGTWNIASLLIPYMKERGGHIVNVASIAGFLGVYGYTDYSASKFGVMGFSESLRSEMEEYNIKVSILCPPDTDTPGFEQENISKPAETKEISKGAKLMTPENVAKVLLKGIMKNKKIIIPGFDGKMTYYLKRFFPGLIDLFLKTKIKNFKKG